MNKFKRFLSLALAVLMTLSYAPTIAYATEIDLETVVVEETVPAEEEIGDTSTDGVISADTNAEGGLVKEDFENPGDTVAPQAFNGVFVETFEELKTYLADESTPMVLLAKDIEVTEEITILAGRTVTLDLYGHNITSVYQTDSTTKHIYPLNNSGNLTIQDTAGTGSISGRGIYNQDDATLTINGAKVVAEDWNGGACVWGYGENSKVYLNNATLIGYTGVVSSEGYVEINGGTYTCYSGIKDDGTYGTSPTYNIRAYNGLKITDGTFTSRHGVISVGGGEAVIEKGSYTIEFAAATTSNVVYLYDDAKLTIKNGEFLSDNTSGKADSGAAVLVYGSDATLTIDDGTFVGMNGMVSGNDNTVINGGSYDTVWDYNHYDNIANFVADGKTVTVGDVEYIKLATGLVINTDPAGTITPAYTSATAIWGEADTNSKTSLVVDLYEGNTKIASASLNNIDNIINGDVYVTWNIPFTPNNDSHWTVVWTAGYPNATMAPDKVVLVVDNKEVDTNNVQLNGPDNKEPVFAVKTDANGDFLGYVTSTNYDLNSVQGALTGAFEDGVTVTLLKDVKITSTVKVDAGETVTLDLNGHVIDGTENCNIAIMTYGNLTIKDSSEAKTGAVKAGKTSTSANTANTGNTINVCGGTFTLESGSIYSLNNAILVDDGAATVNINGGKITADPTTKNSAALYLSSASDTVVNISGGEMVGYNGILLWDNTTINMTGGSIDAKGSTGIMGNGSKDNTEINISDVASVSGYYAAIYHPQAGELNISGNATLTGWTGVVVKGGTVNISGGTISGTGAADDYAPVSSGFIDTGDGLYVEHYDNSTNSENYGTPVVTVTGGTFTSDYGKAVASYANPNNGVEALAGFISGGTFNTEIDEKLLAEGFEFIPTENGYYKVGNVVAQVGNTKYETIDEAVAAWTNGTTLTLLANVTLSDVITLKSTEHHILDLGTYTMTAADGKNAIEIVAYGTGSTERNALTINADATNPGGINAGSKAVIYYKYSDGETSIEDRPIVRITGGVFEGSTASLGITGIYSNGTEARKCMTLNISGGTFNCSIYGTGKSKLLISGGTFNYPVGSQGDSTCYRLISGGTFKSFGFMTADSNNTKFWFGSAMATSDVGVYVDDNDYLVVGGAVIKEAGDKFEASTTNYSGWSYLLQYSSAKDNGLYYTSAEKALADNNKTSGNVTVYAEELDLTNLNYKGTITIVNDTLTVTFAEGTTPAWTVASNDSEKTVTFTDSVKDDVVTRTYNAFVAVAKIGDVYYETLADALTAAATNDTVELIWTEGDAPIAMNGAVYGKTVTITGNATVDWSNGNLFVGRGGEGNGTVIFYNANLTSASNSSSYGIHISGREKGTADKYDGTLIIKNSTIDLDFLINKGTITLDNSTLTVKNGFSVGGRPASETESGEDATATLTLNNNSKVIVNNHNGMGLGYEAIGVMNVNSGSSFETTQSFLITEKGTLNVNGGTVSVTGTLTNKGTVCVSGSSDIKATVTGAGWVYMNGVTLDADTKLIGAKVGFINGTNTVVGSTIDDGWFSVGIGQNTAATTAAAFAEANGITLGDVTVNVSGNAIIGSNGDAYNGWVGSAYGANKTQHKYVLNITESQATFGYLHVSKDGTLNVKGHTTNKYEYDNASVDFYAGELIINGVATFDGTDAWVKFTKVSVDHADGVLKIVNGTNYEASIHNGSNTGNALKYWNSGEVNIDATSKVEIDNATVLVEGAELNIGGNVIAKGAVTGNGTIALTDTDATYTAADGLNVTSDVAHYKVVYADGAYKLVAKVYVAQIGETGYETLAEAAAAIATDGSDTTIKLLCSVEVYEDIVFDYGSGTVTFTADEPVTVKQNALGTDFDFAKNDGNAPKIVIGENVTFEVYDNSSGIYLYYGPSLTLDGAITGGQNWGALYLFQGTHNVTETGKVSVGRVQLGYTNIIVNGEVDTNYLLVENSTFTADGAIVDAGVIYDNNNGGQRWGASKINIKNGSTVEAGTLTLSYADSVLTIDNTSTLDATTITGAGKIVIDGTGYKAGDSAPIIGNASTFTGTIEVINNDDIYATIDENGNIVFAAYVARIGTTGYATLAEAFTAAKDGDEVEILVAGTYALSTSGKDITITGAVDGVVFECGQNNIGMNGASVTFNKVTFNWAANGWPYHGLAHCGEMEYNNCTFNGTVFLYGTSETFTKCEFNVTGDTYNVWTYAADKVVFDTCTFTCAGKSVLVYNEGDGATDLTVTNCKFIASASVDGKAAIEIDTTSPTRPGAMDGTTITIDDKTTATGFGKGSVSGSSLWNDKKNQTNLSVTVAGTKVWPLNADITYGGYVGTSGTFGEESYRENIQVDLYNVVATKSLVVELYSNDNLISTTTLRKTDRDDATKALYPVDAESITANIVVKGRLAGSWDTVWHVDPSVAYMPDTIKVYVDNQEEPVATWNSGFTNASEAMEYKALTGVAKAASVTDKDGNVVDYYATVADAITAAEAGQTVNVLAEQTLDSLTINKGIVFNGNNLVQVNGKLSVTADGATVKNINVNNGSNTAGYISAKDVLIEGCTVVGGNGFRYCYTSGTVTFKDSTITGSVYGIHFDGNVGGNIVIDNCKITGWTSFAGTIEKVTIKDTEFAEGDYNQLRFYQNAELKNVTFNEHMTIDWGKENVSAEFTDCKVVNDDGTEGKLTDVIYLGDIANMGIKATENGKPIVVEAKVGDNYYLTLAEAVDAAESGATVTLLENNVSGKGIVIDKDLTIDFNGNGYIVNEAVGSSGTETLGFQILKDHDVTLKNGRIYADSEDIKMLVQNYSNLTLDAIVLDCKKDDYADENVQYVLSNNSGNINIKNGTGIVAPDGAVAFDVYDWSSAGYAVPTVTVNTTGTIKGKIEVSEAATLVIYDGYFTYEIEEAWCAVGYAPVKLSDALWTVSNEFVAQNMNTLKTYGDLSAALSEAKEDETVKLLKSFGVGGYVLINPNVTLDLNGKVLTAGYVVGFGNAQVADNSDEKTGVLKVSAPNLVLNPNNVQMPIYNGTGYVFGTIKNQYKVLNATADYLSLKFRPSFYDFNNLMADGALDNGISIAIRFEWDRNDNTSSIQDFVLKDELVASVYSKPANAASFQVSVSGLEGFNNLKVSIVVLSDEGVNFVYALTEFPVTPIE